MTPWEIVTARDPQFLAYLISAGVTPSQYNSMDRLEQAELRSRSTAFVAENGPEQQPGILRNLPGSVVETVKEQGRAVTGVVKSVNRSMNRTLLVVAVIAVAGASVVYRNELKSTADAVKKAIK